MVGAGSHVFAVMGYVISHQQPDPELGGVVRLNTTLLSAIIGDSPERIQSAIDYLCGPDTISTTPDEDGRRLVKVGQFDYRVVNFRKYFAIKNLEDQKAANRERQAKHRAKLKEIESDPNFQEAKAKEYKKRRKPGVREAKKEGAMAGAVQAIKDGFNEAKTDAI